MEYRNLYKMDLGATVLSERVIFYFEGKGLLGEPVDGTRTLFVSALSSHTRTSTSSLDIVTSGAFTASHINQPCHRIVIREYLSSAETFESIGFTKKTAKVLWNVYLLGQVACPEGYN